MILDFDKLFEEYCVDWFKNNADEYDSVEDMESAMPELYETWASAPNDKIGGIAPRMFFGNITSAEELVSILIGECPDNNNPSSLLLDRIVEVKEAAPLLANILVGDASTKLKMLAVNLLREMDERIPLETLINWLVESDIDSDLVEIAIETLKDNAKLVQESLYPLLDKANISQKTYIAEILIEGAKDERTYNLLMELFASGDNIPLYAGYIGKYGDERSAAALYRAIDTCNYLEYIEIKNAIERMGGVVDDERDFSSDMYYKAIKNLK